MFVFHYKETSEFNQMYNGYQLEDDSDNVDNSSLMSEPEELDLSRLPKSVDWRKKGAVTKVKKVLSFC